MKLADCFARERPFITSQASLVSVRCQVCPISLNPFITFEAVRNLKGRENKLNSYCNDVQRVRYCSYINASSQLIWKFLHNNCLVNYLVTFSQFNQVEHGLLGRDLFFYDGSVSSKFIHKQGCPTRIFYSHELEHLLLPLCTIGNMNPPISA